MKQIETSSGFKCELDEGCLDDMELFDAICAMERGDAMQTPIVMSKILGEHKKALYEHLRDEKGRVPTTKAAAELTEIITQLGKK